MEFYTLETIPDTNKQVRVMWDPNDWEYDEPSEHHYSMRDRQINGIGEDGSEWTMGITIDPEAGDWNEEIPAELIRGESSYTGKLTMIDNKKKYLKRYWDENGKASQLMGNVYPVSVKEYFDKTLGEYPNIDPKKGPHWLEREDLHKNPEIRLLSILNKIPSEKIEKTKGPKTEFIQVPEIINGEEKIVTVPTEYGLIVNLLNTNNYTWENEIRPDGIGFNKKNDIVTSLLKRLF